MLPRRHIRFLTFLATLLFFFGTAIAAIAQEGDDAGVDQGVDEELDQGLFEDAQEEPTAPAGTPFELPPVVPPAAESEEPDVEPPVIPPIEGGAPGEGQTRWNVSITAAVIVNYVFNDSPDGFTVKYRFEIKGTANAETAVLRGDADISANVEGPLSRWPTGECRLSISIPKVPYELTFRRTGDEKSSLRLAFRRQINEDWQSSCTFTDAPGARFETRGAPEVWLTKALDKARPPLKDLIADIGNEETTTSFVISKETIGDPPLGSVEIDGTGVITIRPGGE